MRGLVSILAAMVLTGCGGGDEPAQTLADPSPAVAAAPGGAGSETERSQPDAGAVMAPRRPVIEETIAYGEATDRNLTGFLALPEDVFEPPPGVLVIHEWWGLNDDVRALARRLAGEGFVVLAIDLYGDQVAETTTQAQAHMARVMDAPQAALDNIAQGLEFLRRYALAPRVAVYGWSFGGTWSLQAGLSFPEDIDAVVTYYGQIVTDEIELEKLRAPLIGIYAGRDESLPSKSVVEFRSALNGAGREAAVRIFPESRREFANPASENYHHQDAEEAWSLVVDFLRDALR